MKLQHHQTTDHLTLDVFVDYSIEHPELNMRNILTILHLYERTVQISKKTAKP